MKTLEEIKVCKRLVIDKIGVDGGSGHIHIGGWDGSVIWSDGGGWDHVSVRPYKARIIPSWSDMCTLKEAFFHDDDFVIQFHPAKSEYVNNVGNCLHLWRYQGEMPTPPSWMVGLKDGESAGEMYNMALRELHERGEA